MEVRKIMTKNPACATPDSTLQEVAHMMEMYDCGCIPVVEDHKNNKPVGTITDRDIAIRAFSASGSPTEMKASDIMTTDIATITPEASLEDCRNVMEDKQIRRILVVDKSGKCVGIVAQADIVQEETNSHQTAEFIREISEPSGSQYGRSGSSRNQFGVSDTDLSGSRYGGMSSDRDSYRNYDMSSERNDYRNFDMSSERDSYRNFSNQNRGYERELPRREDRVNQSFSTQGRRFKKSRTEEKSFFRAGTLLPLAIAIGAGAALKYFLPVDQKSQTTFVPRSRVTGTIDRTDETKPKVSIELPTEKTDVHTKTNIEMRDSRDINAGGIASSNTGGTASSSLETDSDTTNKIGRTARL